MRALSGILVAALAACSTPSDVVKTGDNAYRVRTNAGGGTPSDAEIKARGIARANEYCEAQGQRAVTTVGLSTGWHLFSMPTAEVQFFCDDRPASRAAASKAACGTPRHARGRRGAPPQSARHRRPAKIARPFD